MSDIENQARASLAQLVTHVFNCHGALLQGITYGQLATRIGRINKHGEGQGHGMGVVLGKMGHLLEGVEDAWGEPIPHIQSLVGQKTSTGAGLPADGIVEFWKEYPALTEAEKELRVSAEYLKIAEFGSRWNEVLKRLEIEPPDSVATQARFGGAGESPGHKKLKDYVRDHPGIVGASPEWWAQIEYVLPSLDKIDVLFRHLGSCIAVEVKAANADACLFEYERGLYQAIKYRAILEGMSGDSKYRCPSSIRSILLIESRLPDDYARRARDLGVEVIENVSPEP